MYFTICEGLAHSRKKGRRVLPLPVEAARMQAIQAVIFDCDGTLVDSVVPGMDVIHAQASALGLVFTREQARSILANERFGTFIDTTQTGSEVFRCQGQAVPASRTNDPVRTMTGILEVATQEFASKG